MVRLLFFFRHAQHAPGCFISSCPVGRHAMAVYKLGQLEQYVSGLAIIFLMRKGMMRQIVPKFPPLVSERIDSLGGV